MRVWLAMNSPIAETALVGGAGFLGQIGDAGSQTIDAVCDGGDLNGKVVQLPLCVAPKGTELVAVSFAFFGETGGDVLDSFKALFVGHGLLKYSGVKVA